MYQIQRYTLLFTIISVPNRVLLDDIHLLSITTRLQVQDTYLRLEHLVDEAVVHRLGPSEVEVPPQVLVDLLLGHPCQTRQLSSHFRIVF